VLALQPPEFRMNTLPFTYRLPTDYLSITVTLKPAMILVLIEQSHLHRNPARMVSFGGIPDLKGD
jgi:hypothetical protein